MWRCGQENEIDLVDDALVGVKTGVLAILGNFDSRSHLSFLEKRKRFVESIRECIGHGDKSGIRIGGKSLLRGAGASTAAAHEPDLDHAAAGRMNQGNGQSSR